MGGTTGQSQSISNCRELKSSGKAGDQKAFHEKTNVTADNGSICEHCKQTFASSSNLQNHKKRVHLKIKDASCELCTYKGTRNYHRQNF